MFIAEIGINHDGSLEKALDLIDIAADAGADVVKFQKRTPRMCVPVEQWHVERDTPWGRMSYIEYRERMEFTEEQFRVIDSYCKSKGIAWTASVWDIPSLQFIMQFDVPFVKIASAMVTNIPLLLAIKYYNVPVVMSVGMSSEREIAMAMNALEGHDVRLLFCKSVYPLETEDICLSGLRRLKVLYPHHEIGYSGHETGILPTLIARGIGAEIIERHITYDKNAQGTDHAASLDPVELKELIEQLKEVDKMMGFNIRICPLASEEPAKKKLRYC